MTLALAINIILSAIVLTTIVGSLIWAITTSRDGQATAPTKIKRLRGLSTDGGRTNVALQSVSLPIARESKVGEGAGGSQQQ